MFRFILRSSILFICMTKVADALPVAVAKNPNLCCNCAIREDGEDKVISHVRTGLGLTSIGTVNVLTSSLTGCDDLLGSQSGSGAGTAIVGGGGTAIISSGGSNLLVPSGSIYVPSASIVQQPSQIMLNWPIWTAFNWIPKIFNTQCCAPCSDGFGICCCSPGAITTTTTTTTPRTPPPPVIYTIFPPYLPAKAQKLSQSISILCSLLMMFIVTHVL